MIFGYFIIIIMSPDESILSFDGSALRVGPGGRVLMASKFAATGFAVMSMNHSVSMGPTVSSRIEFGFPFFLVERSTAAQFWCSIGGGLRLRTELLNEFGVGALCLLELFSE
jgi:hypothetical protein